MCQLGADEDERNYFREAEMAQALGQAQDAIGHSVGSSQAIPLTALVPNNSHTNMSIEVGATGSTPGLLNAMPGTPMSDDEGKGERVREGEGARKAERARTLAPSHACTLTRSHSRIPSSSLARSYADICPFEEVRVVAALLRRVVLIVDA